MAEEFFRVKVEGFADLEKTLRELPNAMAKSVLRSALKKAGQPVVDAAKELAPKATGEFAESIAIQSTLSRRQRRRRAKAGDVELFIGPSGKVARIGHLLEFGTVKMAKRPFLRPAWDANKDRVLQIFVEEMRRALQRAVRRQSKYWI